MTQAYWSVSCDVPADVAWGVVRKFGALPDWHPDFVDSVLVEGASEFEIGAVRVLTLNDGGRFQERLIGIDDGTRTLTYDIISSPLHVRNYRGQLQVLQISDTNSSVVIWSAAFDPTDGTPGDAAADAMAIGAYAPALAALRQYLTA